MRLVFVSFLGVVSSAFGSACEATPGKTLGQGHLKRIENMPDAAGCCDSCNENDRCLSWTFHTADYAPAPNSCYLKDNAADMGESGSSKTFSGLRSSPLPRSDTGRACQAPHDKFPFCNTSLPVHDRIMDLISRISTSSKPNLLTARGLGGDGQYMQSFPELGVPAYYWGVNCLHSLQHGSCVTDSKGKKRCPMNFPGSPSFGALFDRTLVRNMSEAIGRELRASFALRTNSSHPIGLDCWGPMINLNRDPRWGRNAEGGLEDAYAMGEMAKAWVQGFQNPRPSKLDGRMLLQGVITLKHMAANSVENTAPFTRHTFDANATYGMDPFVLQDYYLRPFRPAIREADARGIMCSYNSVLGTPSCLSTIMRDARKQWGFQGYVTSDTDSVKDAYKSHYYVNTAEEAVALALKDGNTDINSGDTFNSALLNSLATGTRGLTEKDVDKALYNTLRQRFDLGLFDPLEAYDWPGVDDVGTDASAELSLRASQSSLVLLRNDNVLPLKAGQRIAVLGPHAGAQKVLVQPYPSSPLCPEGGVSCITSPYDAIREINDAAGGATTTSNLDLFNMSKSDLDQALQLASESDIIILGLGIETCGLNASHNVNPKRPGKCFQWPTPRYVFPDEYLELEAHDRLTIDLPAVQHELAAKILDLGKPTVLFLLNAGAVAIDEEAGHSGAAPLAIVEAFYPGPRGGEALAQSLFGLQNRWGRLPYTIYPKSFEESSMLEHDLRVAPGRTYRYFPSPTFAFGHGLSLTTWSLTVAGGASCALVTTDLKSTCKVQLDVKNTGKLQGDSVILAYWQGESQGRMENGRQFMPELRRLFDYQRVADMTPDQTQRLIFEISGESLAEADEETGDWVIKPRKRTLIFDDGGFAKLEMQVSITGKQVVFEKFPGRHGLEDVFV